MTKLIVRDCHEGRAGHSGWEHTVAVLRQNCWGPQCHKLTDKIVRDCTVCRQVNGQPAPQREAPLPMEHIKPEGHPSQIQVSAPC